MCHLCFVKRFSVVPVGAELVVESTDESTVITPNTFVLVARRAIGIFWEVTLPFVAGLGLAVVFIVWCGIALFCRFRRDITTGDDKRATAASTWSFKDSWATNVTALGAAFGSVISATGTVTSVFPGVPLYRFSILSALCAGTATIAPLVAGLSSKETTGGTEISLARWSLLCAGGLTLLALGGELTSLAMLAWYSSAVTWARGTLIGATGLIGVLAFRYAMLATLSLFPDKVKERFAFSAERSAAI
jgi:hypothetical protein